MCMAPKAVRLRELTNEEFLRFNTDELLVLKVSYGTDSDNL